MEQSFQGKGTKSDKEEFLESARIARLKRLDETARAKAIVVIQSAVRKFLAQKRFKKLILLRFEELLGKYEESEIPSIPSMKVFRLATLFISKYDQKKEIPQLERLCRYIIWSLSQNTTELSYIGCGFAKDRTFSWLRHLQKLIKACVFSMEELEPDYQSHSKTMSVLLSVIVLLTSPANWVLLREEKYRALEGGMTKLAKTHLTILHDHCNFFVIVHKLVVKAHVNQGGFVMKKANLHAIMSLSNNLLYQKELSGGNSLLLHYTQNILTIPALIYYIEKLCPEAMNVEMLPVLLELLTEEKLKNLIKRDTSRALSLLGNVVHMGFYHKNLENSFFPSYDVVIRSLVKICDLSNETTKKSNWHPILGWESSIIPSHFINAAQEVKAQIQKLWSPTYAIAIFHPVFAYVSGCEQRAGVKREGATKPPSRGLSVRQTLYKAIRRTFFVPEHSTPAEKEILRFNDPVTLKAANACTLYNEMISVFPLCKLDILTGLCFKIESRILSSLWRLIQNLLNDPTGLKTWTEVLFRNSYSSHENLLILFADAMIHFTTILDDQELYEEHQLFALQDLADIGAFVNKLCYMLISHMNFELVSEGTLRSLKTLLLVLYRRDCRRRFCPVDHWLIESGKMAQLIHEIEKGRKNSKRILFDMPHVLREDARVIFFRKWANSEKSLNGASTDLDFLPIPSPPSTLITIQRGRIVEDGYAQLSVLSPKALKSTIRVRFQNELGLDEAGIDQDGVFKEFLEETISLVFNPTLNLFKCTSENLLYPSPISYLHDNHLELFEFVGKMLAKAIYEGIVVDVHFAPFFLSQILGHSQNALFSAIDEVRSLDEEIYKSLNYIKHFKGNISDLDLTFSVDQDVLGAIRSFELIPGGKNIPLDDENKISYLYLMAHFHLNQQIREQTAAFLKGFRCILPNEWIRIFSPGELQRLISGEDSHLDLTDLRRNTQYYGGFHDSHRVIHWLWEILEHDFNDEERRLFLKFVTSCSRPPLLGFQNLDPLFSIRCVEVSDDDDTGDTIGSVLRGFLAIGKKEPTVRLPTASTCFNLLKLPNYQKKSTLRDKLRYAITSNVGFELS